MQYQRKPEVVKAFKYAGLLIVTIGDYLVRNTVEEEEEMKQDLREIFEIEVIRKEGTVVLGNWESYPSSQDIAEALIAHDGLYASVKKIYKLQEGEYGLES